MSPEDPPSGPASQGSSGEADLSGESGEAAAASGGAAGHQPASQGGSKGLDLTREDEPATAPPVSTARYDASRDQERMRGWLAGGLLALIALIALILLFAGLGACFFGTQCATIDDIVKLAGVLLSPILTLFGAVTGFYFGGKAGQR